MQCFDGVISQANSDGTFDVDYDDGDREQGVPAELIYVQEISPAPAVEAAMASKFVSLSDPLSVGDAIEARFGGGPDFHSGKVAAVNGDGTYAIDYSDGDKEPAVKRLRIRRLGQVPPETLVQGMRCEARHGGGMQCFDGVISQANSDGTFDVDYDDGDREQGVPAELIYVQEISPAPAVEAAMASKFVSLSDPLSVGDAIEARFGGGPDFHSGKVAAVNGDGTYAIDYSDGDKEPAVKRLRIRRPGQDTPAMFVQGTRCEARHGGGMAAFDGVISKVNSDGTYDVDYDDGDKEQGVPADLIYTQAVSEGTDAAATSSPILTSAVLGGAVQLSDAVEAHPDFTEVDGFITAQGTGKVFKWNIELGTGDFEIITRFKALKAKARTAIGFQLYQDRESDLFGLDGDGEGTFFREGRVFGKTKQDAGLGSTLLRADTLHTLRLVRTSGKLTVFFDGTPIPGWQRLSYAEAVTAVGWRPHRNSISIQSLGARTIHPKPTSSIPAKLSWSAKSDGSFSPEAMEAIRRIFTMFDSGSKGKWGMIEFNAFQEKLAEDPMQSEEEFSEVCESLEVN